MIKEVPVHVIKAYGGKRRVAPLIFNLGATWEASGQFHAPAAPPGIGGRVGPRCRLQFKCDGTR
jgi:hypothetical protein